MKTLLLLLLFFPSFCLSQVQIGQNIVGDPLDHRFGNKVSISQDGNVLAVSSLGFDFNDGRGSTKIYRNVNNTWVQIGQNIVGDGNFDHLGHSISLNSDGSFIALGAPNNDDNGSNAGHVKVYENINDTWVQKGQTIVGEALGDRSGFTINMNSSGNILAISATFNDGISNNAGHVRIFEFVNNSWVQIGQDIEGDVNGIESAWAIDLSIDGNTIAIGSPFVSFNGTASGHVRVYELVNNIWTQIGSNINGNDSDWLGYSVSLSQNGNIVAMSSFDSDFDGPLLGYVRVFENIGNTWIQIGNDILNTVNNVDFGWDSEINEDGNILVVSGVSDNGNGTNSGIVRIFALNNNNWVEIGNVLGDVEGGEFGTSLELNLNGSILAVGVPFGFPGNGAGQAKVFNITDLLSIEDYLESGFNLFPNPTKDQFTIQLNDNSVLQKITIYNTLGQVVLSSNELIVNTSKLASGSYYVQVETNQGKATKKLIKE